MRHFIAIIWCWVGLVCSCSAQSERSNSLELDLDLRAGTAAQGTRYGIYSGSLRSLTYLAPGLHMELYGMQKSGYPFWQHLSSDFMLQQATLQKDWGAQRLQLGMIRLPFGIYDYQETYASGLIDYPMPRVNYGLDSVDWGVPGVKWSGGSPDFQFEAAAFEGRATGVWENQNTLGGGALRAQAYIGSLLLGFSRWDGYLDLPSKAGINRAAVHENGFDLRFTRPHLLLRGELLFGILGGDQMQGEYLDIYYHLPKYAKWTLTARLEALRPEPDMPLGQQLTLGVRYTASPHWVFTLNWRRNNRAVASDYSWTGYTGADGAVLAQIYYTTRINF